MQETEKKKVAYVGEGLAPPAHANVLIHKKCTAQLQKAAITPFYIRKNNMVLLGGASPSPTAKPSFVQAKLYFATAAPTGIESVFTGKQPVQTTGNVAFAVSYKKILAFESQRRYNIKHNILQMAMERG